MCQECQFLKTRIFLCRALVIYGLLTRFNRTTVGYTTYKQAIWLLQATAIRIVQQSIVQQSAESHLQHPQPWPQAQAPFIT